MSKTIKKNFLFTIFIIFMFAILTMVGCSSNKVAQINFPADFSASSLSINVDGSYVFVADNKMYFAYGETKTEITAPITDTTIFTTFYDKIYVTGENKIDIYNTKNENLDSIPIENLTINSMIATNDNLIVQTSTIPASEEEQPKFNVEIIDLKTKSKEAITDFADAQIFALKNSYYNRIGLLSFTGQAVQYIDYDLVKKQIISETPLAFSMESIPTDIAFDVNDTNKVFLMSSGKVLRYDLKTNESEIITSLEGASPYEMARIFVVSDNVYVLRDSTQTVTAAKITPALADDLIIYTITDFNLSNEPRIAEALKQYKEKYPTKNIRIVGLSYETYEQELLKKLESKDTSFDLFFGEMQNISKYVDTKSIKALDKLTVDTTKMFDSIINLNKHNDELYGAPFFYYTLAYLKNPQTDPNFAVTIPEDFTLDNFLALAKESKKDLDGDSTKETALLYSESPSLYDLFEQFNTKEFTKETFDKEMFGKLLDVNKQFFDEKLYMIGEEVTQETAKNIFMYLDQISAEYLPLANFYAPVKIGDDYKYSCMGFSIFKNANTTKEQDVYNFLNIYLSEDVQKIFKSSPIYSDLSIYNITLQEPMTQEELDSNLKAYSTIVNNLGTSKISAETRQQFITLVEQFVTGEITKEDCIDKVIALY